MLDLILGFILLFITLDLKIEDFRSSVINNNINLRIKLFYKQRKRRSNIINNTKDNIK